MPTEPAGAPRPSPLSVAARKESGTSGATPSSPRAASHSAARTAGRKGKMAEAIRGFQATEADGVWHLHRGLGRIADPHKRAILFTHSLEEECHAEEFAHAYRHYGERAFAPANYEREDLYVPSEPAWK